jgi:hypothetical protein
MPESFSIKRGDTLPVLRGTLYADEAKTTPVNLSSAESVIIHMASDVGQATKVSRTVTVIEGGTTGRFEITFTEAEMDTAASFKAEFEVVWAVGPPVVKQTYPKEGFVVITVNPDLGTS